MRRASALRLLILLMLSLSSSARGIVMLNIQWNEDREEWETRPLLLEGEGVSLNRDYQNAYGYAMDLPPGPPFVITDDIFVYNIVEDDYVTDWGSITVTTTGEGTDPFVLQFNPSQGPSPGPNTGIVIRGHAVFEGTSSDPVIFAGAFSGIVNPGWYENNENNRPRISLTNCVFDHMGYDGECSSYILSLRAANVTLDNCQFSNFLPHQYTRIIRFEETSSLDPATWDFTMRECRFSNIILDGAPPVMLWGIGGEVRIEGNDFRDVIFDDSSWQDGVLIDLSPIDWGRIAGNTGGGNTNSAFYIKGFSDSEHGSVTLRSSEELPFLINQITVLNDQTLKIEDGSVLKMINNGVEANFQVYGDMIADGTVFTSWQDDSIGGDNDLEPQPPVIGYWGSTNESGILVGHDGTLRLRNSTLRYARSGIDAMGDALVDGCRFERNEYSGFVCGGGIDGHYEITNSTFINNGGVGISIANDGLHQTLTVDNVRSINNSRGINIYGFHANPVDATVSRSVFAGSVKAAVNITVGPGLQTCTLTGCTIAGNSSAGIKTQDYDGDDAVIRFESCVIAGNGYDFFSGEGADGAYIEGGKPLLINNTVAWNKGAGFGCVPPYPYGGDEEVANNIIMRNIGYGYVNYVELPSRLSHNLFHENGTGELRIDADEGVFQSVEDLAVLGGDYATNIDADPELKAGVEGVVDSVRYLTDDNVSYLFSQDAADDGRDLSDLIVRPDIHEQPWYFIMRHSEDTLVVTGDITGIAAPGDTFDIFDHHLDWASAIVDAGYSALPTWPLDIDGDHRMIDGDRNTLADVDIGADEFSADSVTLVVLSPEQDDRWIALEEHNVTWSAMGIDTINLYYQAPYRPDSSYIEIAAKVPASDGGFKWTVPESLSTNCVVMLEDASEPGHSVESGTFTIRSPFLARIGMDGEYEAYDPGVDGWRIGNIEANMWPQTWWSQFDYLNGIDPYTSEPYPDQFNEFWSVNAQPDDFPDWPLFVEAFGADQCYIDTSDGPQHRPSALWHWSQIKGAWGGSCFGFGVSSFQAFDDKATFLASFPEVDNFDSLYSLEMMEDFRHRTTINTVMTRQHSREFREHLGANITKDVKTTLHEMREMLLDDTRDDCALALINNHGSGGHLVNPYRIRKDDRDSDTSWVYVYDSNRPGDRTARIMVDEATNLWNYSNLPGWGASSGFFLIDPASNHLSPPTIADQGLRRRDTGRAAVQNGNHIGLYCVPGATVTIMDDSGHSIGFADSSAFNTIPGAVPLIPLESGHHPPIGFLVPAGSYTAALSDFPDTIMSFSVVRDSSIINCVRCDAGGAQTDRIVCEDGLLLGNYDIAVKVINTRTITIGTNEERVFDILGVFLSQDDSIGFEAPDREIQQVSNHGGGKMYDLGIRSVSQAGTAVFEHGGITLPGGTGHEIVPDWENLETALLKIYIDTGNDGTVDDSMFVENEYVATLLQNFSASFRDACIEIRWRLSRIDDGTEFELLRDSGDETGFSIIHDPAISRRDLTFTARDLTITPGGRYRYRVIYRNEEESSILFETGEIATPSMPVNLYQNYPNPFNPQTTIRYYLPVPAQVLLEIYDVAGRRIATLVDGRRDAGAHAAAWDGTNMSGLPVDSGIYFCRLKAGKQTISRKMVILK